MSKAPEYTSEAIELAEAEVKPAAGGLQPLLTLGEVAAFLRVSDKTVQRLVATRRLPCVRIGRRVRFTSADVFRFVAARKD